MNIQGIVFDFDGVLVDTEWAIYSSWARLYEREGCTITLERFNECLGSGYTRWDPGAWLEHLTGRQYDWKKENAARQVEIERDLEQTGLMPGAAELLNFIETQGLPMAVASSSSRHWVEGWLRRLGIFNRFQGTFCRTDGYPVKPAPDLFLAAAHCLRLQPEHCLVFEDSANGVLAAHCAGMPCIALPNRVTCCADFSTAFCKMKDLGEALIFLKERIFPKINSRQ
ncbi:MAG: HAD family phosphatase [Akkermansiaceae bacterium]|nr:HAD family phosphatase [Akkermansiaceae bacterium]